MAEESIGDTMARTIDTRMVLEDDAIAFIESEVKRMQTSGRAGYFTQLLTAIQLAQRGDTSLLGAFAGQAMNAPQSTAGPVATSGNQGAVDAGVKEMF